MKKKSGRKQSGNVGDRTGTDNGHRTSGGKDLSGLGRLPVAADKFVGNPGSNPMEVKYEAALGYARYSSDLQNEFSGRDQNEDNADFIEKVLCLDVPMFLFRDDAVPGAQVVRDGLTEAIEKTKQFKSGVFVVESISRLGRSVTLCIQVISDLADRGWRFISRREQVDTLSPMWPVIAAVMASCAELDNQLRAEMVRRGRRHAFHRGVNVGNYPALHYQLVRQDPNDPDSSNLLVTLDEFRDGINEVFQRLLSGQTPVEVARWINTLPDKLGKDKDWEYDDVVRMVSNPRYKGAVRDCNTKRILVRKTGNRPPQANDPADVQWRHDLRQQFVEPSLWDAVNDLLEKRKPDRGSSPVHMKQCLRDENNRRSGVWPSGALMCGECGAKLYRARGGSELAEPRYTCSCSYGICPTCWNYLSADVTVVRQEITKAVVDELLRIDEQFIDRLLKEAERQVHADSSEADPQAARDAKSLREVERKISNVVEHMEAGRASPTLGARLAELEQEKAQLESRQRIRQAASANLQVPTRQEVLDAIADIQRVLAETGDELWPVMRSLVPRATVYPVRIKGCDKPKMMAECEVHLLALLPTQWQAVMRQQLDDEGGLARQLLIRNLRVFVSPLPKYIRAALALKQAPVEGSEKQVATRLTLSPGSLGHAKNFMKHLVNGELVVERLDTLPNRRHYRKVAPGIAGQAFGNTADEAEATFQRLAPRVREYVDKGFTPTGIARRLGSTTLTIERILERLAKAG